MKITIIPQYTTPGVPGSRARPSGFDYTKLHLLTAPSKFMMTKTTNEKLCRPILCCNCILSMVILSPWLACRPCSHGAMVPADPTAGGQTKGAVGSCATTHFSPLSLSPF